MRCSWVGVFSRYITYEECIEVSVNACRKLQGIFGSWDQMVDNYMAGYYIFSGWEEGYLNGHEFFKKSPEIYAVNWNTILDANDVIPPRK